MARMSRKTNTGGPNKSHMQAVKDTHGGPSANTGFGKAKNQAASTGGSSTAGPTGTSSHKQAVKDAKSPHTSPNVASNAPTNSTANMGPGPGQGMMGSSITAP